MLEKHAALRICFRWTLKPALPFAKHVLEDTGKGREKKKTYFKSGE